jgi:hypothetical protein
VYLPPGTIVKFSTGMKSKNRKEWYDFLRIFRVQFFDFNLKGFFPNAFTDFVGVRDVVCDFAHARGL